MNKTLTSRWEEFYGENKYSMWFPSEQTVKFFGRVSKKKNLKGLKGLDFGCGVGRNTFLMSKLGIRPWGVDISKNAISLAKSFSEEQDFNAEFSDYDGKNLPFENEFFDFVISHGVLDHIDFSKAKELMDEIKRVTKKGGMVELELHSIKDSGFGKGSEVGKNMYMREDIEFEKGIPQHFFSEEELLELVKDWKIERVGYLEDQVLDENLKKLGNSSFWIIYLKKNE